jgi:hypothetical protein
MKARLLICFLASTMISISGSADDKSWGHYVQIKPTNIQSTPGPSTKAAFEYMELRKNAFRAQLDDWKKNQAEDLKHYEAMGFSKKVAQKAINERIQWAEKVIESGFSDNLEVPQIVGFVENRIAVMKHIGDMGHDRFKALTEKYHIDVPASFYGCLCKQSSSGVAIGGGVSYKNGKCIAVGVLGGTWEVAFPNGKDAKAWGLCAKLNNDNNGNNILQTISQNIIFNSNRPASVEDIVATLTNRNGIFKNNCLPALSGNVEQQTLNPNDLTQSALMHETLMLSQNADNICEEAVATNLFLMSRQGKSNAAVAADVLMIWVLPDELFIPGVASDYIFRGSKAVLGNAVPVASKMKNLYQTAQRLDKEFEARTLDAAYKEAYELFKESKNWSAQKIKDHEEQLNQALSSFSDQMKKIDDDYDKEMKAEYTASMLRKQQRDSLLKADGAKTTHDVYDEAQKEAIRNRADIKKYELLLERSRLLLKRKVISEFRKPLSEDSCDTYLAKREQMCKEQLAREAQEQKIEQEKTEQIAIDNALKRAADIPLGEPSSPSGGVVGPHITPKK